MDAGTKDLPVEFFPRRSAVCSCPACSSLRGAPVAQAPPQLAQLRRVHLHDLLRQFWGRRFLAGHQPRAHVARERQQLPGLQRGELRHDGLERERLQAPARGLLQQGAEPVERAWGSVPRRVGLNPNRP